MKEDLPQTGLQFGRKGRQRVGLRTIFQQVIKERQLLDGQFARFELGDANLLQIVGPDQR